MFNRDARVLDTNNELYIMALALFPIPSLTSENDYIYIKNCYTHSNMFHKQQTKKLYGWTF